MGVKLQITVRPDGELRTEGSDFVTPDGRRIASSKLRDLGNGRYEFDSSNASLVLPQSRINTLTELAKNTPGGVEAIAFDPNKMFIDVDGKVYTRNAKGEPELIPDQKAFDPESNSVIIGKDSKDKANSQINSGMSDPGKVISQKEAPEALKPKDNETWDQWTARMEKFGTYAIYTGIAALGITTVASFIAWLRAEADAVNGMTFKINQIERKGKISFSAEKTICAGDNIYGFAGFDAVNKQPMIYSYTTNGGANQLNDPSQIFEEIGDSEKITPPAGKELTFRVTTTQIRRLTCTLAQIASDTARQVASAGRDVAESFWAGLGIDPVWLIGGIIGLVVLAIVASIFLKK